MHNRTGLTATCDFKSSLREWLNNKFSVYSHAQCTSLFAILCMIHRNNIMKKYFRCAASVERSEMKSRDEAQITHTHSIIIMYNYFNNQLSQYIVSTSCAKTTT